VALTMGIIFKLNNLFRPARLSRRRMVCAVFVAVVADGLQIPLQVPPLPEIIDVVAMVLTTALIGFHVLLLPTFAIEFIPMVSVLPTWTGCVLAVIALRRRTERQQPGPPPVSVPPVILPPPSPQREGERREIS
jgi:hypothetical protein